MVFAREAGDEGERAFWRRTMGGDRTDDDFHRAVALLALAVAAIAASVLVRRFAKAKGLN